MITVFVSPFPWTTCERRTLSLGALEKTSTRGATVERFTEVPEGF